MGKLSKLLLGTIVCLSAHGQDDPTFQVVNCNADVSIKFGEKNIKFLSQILKPQNTFCVIVYDL